MFKPNCFPTKTKMTIESAQGPAPELVAGHIDGKIHRLPVRVYYEDTDFSGAVYHANYLKYCERGRSDFLRLLGIGHRDLEAGDWGGESLGFVVRRMTVDFLKPARIDDLLSVTSEFASHSGARLNMTQRVLGNEGMLFEALVTIAMVDGRGRVARIPKALTDKMARYLP